MLPVIPFQVNKLLQDKTGKSKAFPFPPNIADRIPSYLRKQIFLWLLNQYCWPQMMQRQTYEVQWDKLLSMARASWKITDMELSPTDRLTRSAQKKALEGNATPGNRADISDTVIFDAIDRLNNLNHFISFKEALPVQFNMPKNVVMPNENSVYAPTSNLITAANALLKFCADGADFYRNHWINGKHHYTYGISFVNSEFKSKVEPVMRRQADGSFAEQPELTELGITFEPISIRKLWLNPTIRAYDMQYQPCPFFFDEIPRFAIIANAYNPEFNPFGYVNLDKLPAGEWLFAAQEMDSFDKAFKEAYPNATLQNLGDPEKSPEIKWTLYPMMPLKAFPLQEATPEVLQELQTKCTPEELQMLEASGEYFDFDFDGKKKYQYQRYLVETFGGGLTSGKMEFLRIQKNFYPRNQIPLYGSCHMPDLDSGLYPPALGIILESHYIQICTALNQWLDNKNLLNDPPTKVQLSSPSLTKDLNVKGQKNPVNSMNDYEEHAIVDHTGTTPAFLDSVRGAAQTSSKAVEALMGKAMGARTSATEASNVFQTAMSGVTTDINLYNHDISGGFAERVWDYCGLWVDPEVLKLITGQYGFAIEPQHFQIRLEISWDTGSSYIESVTRQGNLRYLLESTNGDPSVNRPYLLRELLEEWRFKNIDLIVNDQGLEDEITLANQQACETYLGELVMVDPGQNHGLAVKVKMSYLKDRGSIWNSNPKYAINGNLLVKQIELHQMYLRLEAAQAEAAQIAQNLQPLQNGNN